ncbi:MAG: hypothetical protein UEJ45_09015 [Peptococcaceae bacterium]|nr:hypothetical protein [Peptococcaceae bacterium]
MSVFEENYYLYRKKVKVTLSDGKTYIGQWCEYFPKDEQGEIPNKEPEDSILLKEVSGFIFDTMEIEESDVIGFEEA